MDKGRGLKQWRERKREKERDGGERGERDRQTEKQ